MPHSLSIYPLYRERRTRIKTLVENVDSIIKLKRKGKLSFTLPFVDNSFCLIFLYNNVSTFKVTFAKISVNFN